MKIFTGVVIHTKMDKTALVAIKRLISHPVYKKRLRRIRKYLVHDEFGVKQGQRVRFVASKPISKLKKFTIIEVLGEPKNDKNSGKKGAK